MAERTTERHQCARKCPDKKFIPTRVSSCTGGPAAGAVLRALPKVCYWEMSGLSPNPLHIDGSLALASLNRTCRDHCPDFSAALTTMAFDQSGLRWLGISDLIAEPEGPTFISCKVARSRLDRLRS